MSTFDNLAQFADDLRKRGFEADYEVLYCGNRFVEGLDVADEFFPLWELTEPENEAALEKLDFEAIKARRPSDWSAAPPPRKHEA
jgi:hypothetical protein